MPTNQDLNPQNGMQGTSYIYDHGTSPNTRTAVSQKARVLTPAYGNSQALWQMGALSQFSPNISRSVDHIRGIGFGDKVAEVVPSVTDPPTADFERALLYLSNLWQSTGYAAGIDGPVRSLAHHRWPFDVEEQLVFSSLADADLGFANTGASGGDYQTGKFSGGVKQVTYGAVTEDSGGNPGANSRGHSAIITMYESCWFTSWSRQLSKDSGQIMESGSVTISDVHDFASMYGEFLATGNDPTIGQLGSVRFADISNVTPQAGGGTMAGGGGTQAVFVDQ